MPSAGHHLDKGAHPSYQYDILAIPSPHHPLRLTPCISYSALRWSEADVCAHFISMCMPLCLTMCIRLAGELSNRRLVRNSAVQMSGSLHNLHLLKFNGLQQRL